MNAGSILVLAILFSLVALAIWRALKKGAPCACGGDGKACGGCRRCHKAR